MDVKRGRACSECGQPGGFLKSRIEASPRLRQLGSGKLRAMALATVALLLARPIRLARARLPVFAGAQVQVNVDEWPYFRGEGVYRFSLQTPAAPQEVQLFYQRIFEERGWDSAGKAGVYERYPLPKGATRPRC